MSSLTSEQQAAAYTPNSVVVTAGAGTGKTHMLAERYLYYLQARNLSPLQIVAVTFTEKAATELRSRIRALVIQQMPERSDILAELEAAQISTIHALASRICQEHWQTISIPADLTLLDDLEAKIWLNDSLNAALINLPRQFYEVIPYTLMSDVLSKLLDDPYTAELAFQQGIQDWKSIIEQAKITVLKNLVDTDEWQQTETILDRDRGKAGDKLETLRQAVISAMANIAAETNIDEAIAVIARINLRVGSQKNWQGDSLKEIKQALTSVRDLVRKVIKRGLLGLELTAADEQLKVMLTALTEAYREVVTYLNQLKQQAGVLTFSDLEIYALQGLNHSSVREYYQQRWRVFLVDEFQDTNPTQAELLTLLTEDTELTIVGDIKQSIYGFRRADVRVFKQFRDRILQRGGKEVILSRSFRTHQDLLKPINQIFAPLFQAEHQELTAHRQHSPLEDKTSKLPHVRVITVEAAAEKTSKLSKAQRQRIEAQAIAEQLQQLLETSTPVYDKQTRQLRPMQPQDIAILTRTWQPLEIYAEALAAAGIPVAPAGGGNLLATREAKDATALLRWLADPKDDIALVAVLRSPFFAVSDRVLFELGQELDTAKSCWWERVKTSNIEELTHPIKVLQQLAQRRYEATPTRLLQIADRLTGYTAVMANLPGAERRLADWRGFRELIKTLEPETKDLFGVVRRLKRLYDREVAVPRPVLAVDRAVSLMTIFAAKGLECSLVVVADLSRELPTTSSPVYFDARLGVALKFRDTTGETQKPVLYTWLEYQQQQQETAEALRVLYVALTRARDYLILSAAEADKGDLARLSPGLSAANLVSATIPLTAEKALPPIPPTPPPPDTLPPLLLNPVAAGLSELPATALTEYARCPQRFYLNFIEGHPGIGEGMATGKQIGTLVHKALEHNITEVSGLLPFADASWEQEAVTEALALAKRFFQLPLYRSFRHTAIAKEQPVSLQIGKITFNGIVDLIGNNWVLDYKSDRHIAPQVHRFQLWIYVKALEYQQAHIVYLRHNYVHSFSESELTAIAPEALLLAERIYQGNYTATPTMEKCAVCPFLAVCDFVVF